VLMQELCEALEEAAMADSSAADAAAEAKARGLLGFEGGRNPPQVPLAARAADLSVCVAAASRGMRASAAATSRVAGALEAVAEQMAAAAGESGADAGVAEPLSGSNACCGGGGSGSGGSGGGEVGSGVDAAEGLLGAMTAWESAAPSETPAPAGRQPSLQRLPPECPLLSISEPVTSDGGGGSGIGGGVTGGVSKQRPQQLSTGRGVWGRRGPPGPSRLGRGRSAAGGFGGQAQQ
jgi:hypothetical protein